MRNTYGKDNVVSAVLHMDEKTPHIHATIIPIVTGKRRKATNEQKPGKKKYRTKSADAPRLCADDVMSRVKLKEYQDSYAEAMSKYGLQRGIEGSKANHISTREYYANLIGNQENLLENMEILIDRQDGLRKQERQLYDLRDGVKAQFYEADSLLKKKEKELTELEEKAEQLERRANPDKFKEDFELISSILPDMESILRIVKFCIGIGIPKEMVKTMVAGNTVKGSGKLYSHEYKRHFQPDNIILRIEKDTRSSGLILTINGQDHIHWFRQKYKDEMKQMGVDLDAIEKKQQQNKNRGIR